MLPVVCSSGQRHDRISLKPIFSTVLLSSVLSSVSLSILLIYEICHSSSVSTSACSVRKEFRPVDIIMVEQKLKIFFADMVSLMSMNIQISDHSVHSYTAMSLEVQSNVSAERIFWMNFLIFFFVNAGCLS